MSDWGVEHCLFKENKDQVGRQVLDLSRTHLRKKAQAQRCLGLPCAWLPGPGISPTHWLLVTLTGNLLDSSNLYLAPLSVQQFVYATVSTSLLKTFVWDLAETSSKEHGARLPEFEYWPYHFLCGFEQDIKLLCLKFPHLQSGLITISYHEVGTQ